MSGDPLAHPERLIRRVYAYVAYRIGAGSEAEDVTSETFERALRYRDSFDPRKGTPLAWLLGIARSTVAGRRLRVHEQLDAEAAAGADEIEEQVAARLDLQAALERLDERDQELISLRYGADLSSKQIGELLGLEPGAVDVSLHRARSRLRAALGEAERV
jgi:RNA polymerase sigma factor (sigma-70 family)